MRRSSIITIILLVLVIIGLTVALVFTNLPEKDNTTNSSAIENNDKVEENKPEEEKPKEMSLDSDIATKMDAIISICFPKDYFHIIKRTCIQKNDIADADKLAIAYKYAEKGREDIPKSEMDKLVMEVFGSSDYVPQEFFIGLGSYEYKESEEKFVPTTGWGGGGPRSHSARGIYKIDEYSDRYEVYEKYLYIENTEREIREKNTPFTVELWSVRDCNSFYSNVLTNYVVRGETDYNTIHNEVQGIVAKNFVKSNNGTDEYEDEMKVLTKYYDQASEYKHTFMKNEDGTFYWYKSEIVK